MLAIKGHGWGKFVFQFLNHGELSLPLGVPELLRGPKRWVLLPWEEEESSGP